MLGNHVFRLEPGGHQLARRELGRWIHVNICLEEHKLCLLVPIGARADGRKELVYPAEHWRHLRTTNPIGSTVATVRHRTKGPGSRAAGLAMAFKLIESSSPAGARSPAPTWSHSSGLQPPSSTASSPNAPKNHASPQPPRNS